MMRGPAVLLLSVTLLVACDSSVEPPGVSGGDPLLHHSPAHANALVERAWRENVQWELVKPRPPGIGTMVDDEGRIVRVAPGLEGARTRVYQIAPVNAGDPLSPPIHIPGIISIGGRDHVVRLAGGGASGSSGVGQTVPVLVPGWNPAPPFDASACALPDLVAMGIADRIAWRWLDPAPHPCGRAPQVYAARLAGESCVQPLTSVARIEAAAEQGLVQFAFPPEPPWPFAVRPITQPGAGRVAILAPACVS